MVHDGLHLVNLPEPVRDLLTLFLQTLLGLLVPGDVGGRAHADHLFVLSLSCPAQELNPADPALSPGDGDLAAGMIDAKRLGEMVTEGRPGIVHDEGVQGATGESAGLPSKELGAGPVQGEDPSLSVEGKAWDWCSLEPLFRKELPPHAPVRLVMICAFALHGFDPWTIFGKMSGARPKLILTAGMLRA
jgi:hypothetical protein